MSIFSGAISRPNDHPRRRPAHQSVSLRHTSPTKQWPLTSWADQQSQPRPQSHVRATTSSSPAGPASDKANPPSTISPKCTTYRQNSGESSDAGKWFENTNNNAVQSNTSLIDNDPPFLLRNSSSSSTPPDGHDTRLNLPPRTSMPYRPSMALLGTDGSSTEDFRSVIDDLTIVNKKLKQKLRKYEKLYDAHLQDEKLFEVRFHGLPDHKKKELEDVLQKFAADMDDTPVDNSIQRSYAPIIEAQKTSLSHNSRFAESGYVSMSASGQNSVSTPSNQASLQAINQENDHRKMTASQYNRNQQNVHSYLHDIPAGLFPKNRVSMTEKSRKKLVVRRLEQIFAGKQSAPGTHPQPMQQEEVAQSAAMADREAKKAIGEHSKREGAREARIMPVHADDEHINGHIGEAFQKSRPAVVSEEDFAGSGSPDQRPTRPLDLDLYRAQVPAENMNYIRHLGFSPPDILPGFEPDDDHGWLYLNLLINMAQLHTFNVTPDFVKDSVAEYSSKLELSHDGRKIRWNGNHGVNAHTSDSSSENHDGESCYDAVPDACSKSPSKRVQMGHTGNIDSARYREHQARRTARAQKAQDQNKLMYTPMFYHQEDSDEDDDVCIADLHSSNDSLHHAQQPGNPSVLGSSAMRSSSSKKRRDDGPIIFYNKAKFCTDLSGDRRGLSVANPASYRRITARPLGAASSPIVQPRQMSDLEEPRGPLNSCRIEVDSKDGTQASSSEADFGFSPEALRNNSVVDDSLDIMEFEASGLGGVHPRDNFAIKVRRLQFPSSQVTVRRNSKLYPKRITTALEEHYGQRTEESTSPWKETHGIKEQILSATRTSLPASALPAPSFLPFDSASSGDMDSDLESNVSSRASTTSSSDRGPASPLQLLNVSPTYAGLDYDSCGEEDESDEQEADSDDSVDLLAIARELDPTTVRASEREYDAALADRLVEEIPAGSSAATVGGGSGFNTPVAVSTRTSGTGDGGVDKDNKDKNSAKKQTMAGGSVLDRARGLKRARTNDTLFGTLPTTKGTKNARFDQGTQRA